MWAVLIGGGVRAARREAGRIGWIAVVLLALSALLAGGCAPASPQGGAKATAGGPTATPTQQQRIAALVAQALGGSAQQVEATLEGESAGVGAVTVTVTVGGPVPGTPAEISASQERVKTICYRAEEAVWTSGVPLAAVTVTVVGPIYDDYADLTSGPYGSAVLKAEAASKLDWAQVSLDAAWDDYGVWLRPAYRSRVLGQ